MHLVLVLGFLLTARDPAPVSVTLSRVTTYIVHICHAACHEHKKGHMKALSLSVHVSSTQWC
jgi:hypothetical protein